MPTEHEKQWITAWRLAGPKLQAIRDEELRQKGNKGCRPVGDITVYEPAPHRNGLVTMQAWFSRFQILNDQSARTRPTRQDGGTDE